MLHPRQVLESLLTAGQRAELKPAISRSTSFSLSGKRFGEYRHLPSLQDKIEFDATMRRAQRQGCIDIRWDARGGDDAFIDRITLIDLRGLAAFLELPVQADLCDAAETQIAPWLGEFPVLATWLDRWRRMELVRGYGPSDIAAVLDSVQVVRYARKHNDREHLLRVLSTRLFRRRSKRIEELVPLIDALTGDVPGRAADEVLSALGIRREPQPVLMAGSVSIARERMTSILDRPYHGMAPESVMGISESPDAVLTVENKTTFHLLAQRECDSNVLVLYSGGMPSPAWRGMYGRILKGVALGTPVYHWGDIDEGGFRIARVISQEAAASGHVLRPWLMDSAAVTEQENSEPVSQAAVMRAAAVAREIGWTSEAEHLLTIGRFDEQEYMEVQVPWRTTQAATAAADPP